MFQLDALVMLKARMNHTTNFIIALGVTGASSQNIGEIAKKFLPSYSWSKDMYNNIIIL